MALKFLFPTLRYFLLFFYLLFIKNSCESYSYKIKYISVPVDHFSFVNNGTFKLRYLINDTYWDSNGPIFFYTGNEGDITLFAENTGFMWEIAEKFGALVIFAEHRYYGNSLPFGKDSFRNNSQLGYLSSTQALADYVYLIDWINKNQQNNFIYRKKKHPVIAFGGSYGGMLAAWIRMKYPASVLGAIAASAPIFQFQGLTSCETYNEILTNVYHASSSHNQSCSGFIKKSWPALREVTSTTDGMEWLFTTWRLCTVLKTKDDIENLINWLTNVYSNMAMTNYPYEANFLAPLPAYPVRQFCKRLKSENIKKNKKLLENLGEALQIFTNYTTNNTCVNTNNSSSNIGEKVWEYQACNEIIMPMCSGRKEMFEESPWNYTEYSEYCFKKFGVYPRRPDTAILEYGGKDIKTASNIVFSNGLLDPWCGGGVLQNFSKSVLAILIPDGAHHIDLRGSNAADPESIVKARIFHEHQIHNWLKSYENELSSEN